MCPLSMDKVVRFKIVVDSANVDSNRPEDTLKGFIRSILVSLGFRVLVLSRTYALKYSEWACKFACSHFEGGHEYRANAGTNLDFIRMCPGVVRNTWIKHHDALA